MILLLKSEKPAVDVACTIIMKPKMAKKGRSKGTAMPAIALPSKKKIKLASKTQNVATPLLKLRLLKKNRLILECFCKVVCSF